MILPLRDDKVGPGCFESFTSPCCYASRFFCLGDPLGSMQIQGGWKKDMAKTCQVCKRWVLQRRSSMFNSTLQFPRAVTDLGNAGEERFDFNVGVDDFELMIPQTSRDCQSPQQASLAPNKAKQY